MPRGRDGRHRGRSARRPRAEGRARRRAPRRLRLARPRRAADQAQKIRRRRLLLPRDPAGEGRHLRPVERPRLCPPPLGLDDRLRPRLALAVEVPQRVRPDDDPGAAEAADGQGGADDVTAPDDERLLRPRRPRDDRDTDHGAGDLGEQR
jgi:hypothetical protein